MKIGILSDTHDNLPAVIAALQKFHQRSVELILHCGDIQSPRTVKLFRGVATHFVFGNCDWEQDLLAADIGETGAKLHQPFGELELEGKTIGWVHSHDSKLFSNLEFADRFDYLFYGHTHQAEQHRRGRTLVVNPGALYRTRCKTCLVLDLLSDELETIEVSTAS